MKIKKLNSFCKTSRGDIGIVEAGTFAAQAWLISDEVFDSISGNKFSWIAPDGGSYTDDRSIFERPTEEEVINGLSDRLKEKALETGLIEIEGIV